MLVRVRRFLGSYNIVSTIEIPIVESSLDLHGSLCCRLKEFSKLMKNWLVHDEE